MGQGFCFSLRDNTFFGITRIRSEPIKIVVHDKKHSFYVNEQTRVLFFAILLVQTIYERKGRETCDEMQKSVCMIYNNEQN